MEGIDVQAFISSQRAKLSREKEKLSEDRYVVCLFMKLMQTSILYSAHHDSLLRCRTPRGILPSGKQTTSKAERLRQERVSEYHDFLKDTEKGRATYYPTKSVAEIRWEMAHERHKELETGQSTSRPDDVQNRGDDYGSLKERRLAEERQYRGEVYRNPAISRKRWDDVESSSSKSNIDNKDKNPPFLKNKAYSQQWEDEEQKLVKWARNQNRSNSQAHRNRAPTPPTYESPHKRGYHQHVDDDHKSMRSISAPVIAGGFGTRDVNPQAQRDKQRRYAEELRAQIREKEEAKQKYQRGETVAKKPQVKLSPERTHLSSSTGREDDIESKSYNWREQREYSQRAPRSPYRDRQERFAPYPAPSHFADHPGYTMPHGSYHPWMPPFYPPREMYRHHDRDYPPHGNPYYPPPHPYPHPMNNPYLPPHDREHGSDFRDSRSQRRLRYEDEVDHYRSPPMPQKENLSPQSCKKDCEDTSPLSGGSGKAFKQDKSSYRAELEKQMREKKERDLKAKFEKERYELKKETEIYDPFGKGGCGAPVRDQHGNVVADLKRIHNLNEERLNATTTPSPDHTHARPPSAELSPRTILNYEKLDEVTQKKSSQESYRDYLRQQVQEKEELKQKEKEKKMMEEQREQERLAKERQKLQEDYEHELRLQRMKEEEARLKNEEIKLEVERKRREAARKIEEEQLRDAKQERQAIDEQRRTLVHVERMEQPLASTHQPRSSSPPIPTLRHKMNQFADPPHTPDRSQQNIYRSSSPPVPALQHKQQLHVTSSQTQQEQISTGGTTQGPVVPIRSSSPPIPTLRNKQQQSEVPVSHQEQMSGGVYDTPGVLDTHSSSTSKPELQNYRQVSGVSTRTQSRGSAQSSDMHSVDSNPQNRQPPSDVLTQLAAMRKHLQSQFAKQQPPPAGPLPQHGRQQKPILPAPKVRRKPGESAVSSALNEFTSFKIHRPGGVKPPVSNIQQERNRRYQSAGELLSSESLQYPLQAHPFQDGRPTLHNGDAIIHQDSNISVPPSGNNLAPRRRQWGRGAKEGPRIPSAGGQSYLSVATLEVDSMAAKNEDRMRRLDAILNAGGNNSGGSGLQETRTQAQSGPREQDPHTIIHNFLRRGGNTGNGGRISRQSEMSLDCETGFQQLDSLHS